MMTDTPKLSLEILSLGRLYLVTKILLNLDLFDSILAAIQHFELWKSAIIVYQTKYE